MALQHLPPPSDKETDEELKTLPAERIFKEVYKQNLDKKLIHYAIENHSFENLSCWMIFFMCQKLKLGEEYFQVAVDKGIFDGVNPYQKLIRSTASGSLLYVKEAIQEGANINPINKNCDSPLIIASEFGHLEIVKFLIKNGANVNYQERKNYSTALSRACDNSQIEVVQYLCDHGAEINMKKNNGNPVLKEFTDETIVKYLVKKGLDVKLIHKTDLDA